MRCMRESWCSQRPDKTVPRLSELSKRCVQLSIGDMRARILVDQIALRNGVQFIEAAAMAPCTIRDGNGAALEISVIEPVSQQSYPNFRQISVLSAPVKRLPG